MIYFSAQRKISRNSLLFLFCFVVSESLSRAHIITVRDGILHRAMGIFVDCCVACYCSCSSVLSSTHSTHWLRAFVTARSFNNPFSWLIVSDGRSPRCRHKWRKEPRASTFKCSIQKIAYSDRKQKMFRTNTHHTHTHTDSTYIHIHSFTHVEHETGRTLICCAVMMICCAVLCVGLSCQGSYVGVCSVWNFHLFKLFRRSSSYGSAHFLREIHCVG